MIIFYKLGRRLFAGYVLLALFVAVTGGIGVYVSQQISDSFLTTANNATPAIRALFEIKSTLNDIDTLTADFELAKNPAVSAEPSQEINVLRSGLIGQIERMGDKITQYRETSTNANEAEIVQKIVDQNDRIISKALGFIELTENTDGQTLTQQRDALRNEAATMHKIIDAVITREIQSIQIDTENSKKLADSLIVIITAIALCAFVIALLVGFFLSNYISRSTQILLDAIGKVKDGVLSVDIPLHTKDEMGLIGESFRDLAHKLQIAQQKIERNADELAATNQALYDKNAELEKFNKMMIGREIKMVELKEEIRQLRSDGSSSQPDASHQS